METVHEIWCPEYDARFHCKGGACRSSCCTGWGISLTQDEYFRLLGMACSPALRARLDVAFHPAPDPTPQRYALISPNWQGDCPLHDADGLCMLQKECGEEALSSICRYYPRTLKQAGGAMEGGCSNSCEAVVELLMAQQAPLKFIRRSVQGLPRPVLHPAGGFRLPIREACIRQLQDRSASLPDRILRMGAYLMRLEAASAAELPGRLSLSLSHRLPETTDTLAASALLALCGMVEALAPSSPSMQRFGAVALERYSPSLPIGQALKRYRGDSRSFDGRFPLGPRPEIHPDIGKAIQRTGQIRPDKEHGQHNAARLAGQLREQAAALQPIGAKGQVGAVPFQRPKGQIGDRRLLYPSEEGAWGELLIENCIHAFTPYPYDDSIIACWPSTMELFMILSHSRHKKSMFAGYAEKV